MMSICVFQCCPCSSLFITLSVFVFFPTFSFTYLIFWYHSHLVISLCIIYFFIARLALSQIMPKSFLHVLAFYCLCYLMKITIFEPLLRCLHQLNKSKSDYQSVNLVGHLLSTVTQGFHDKPCDWKHDFFFARCDDLGSPNLRGN